MISSSWSSFFAQIAVLFPAFLIAVSFHECSHAVVAYFLGDSTAKHEGRLTLNPLAHLDIVGLVCLILFRFGWANPVPINDRNFKHPRVYSILTAFAGPFSNFLLATLCFVCIKYLPAFFMNKALYITVIQILLATAHINIMLGVFNLLPLPPLDGSHVITALFIKRFPAAIEWLYQYSIFILLIFFLLPQTNMFLSYSINIVETFLKTLVF